MLGEEKGFKMGRCDCVCVREVASLKRWTSWRTISMHLPICVPPHFFMFLRVCGGQRLTGCFVLIQRHEQTAVHFIQIMIDDVC